MLLELFGTFAGQLSLAVILFMIGMFVFFRSEEHTSELQSH